jgi:hypothetical protein
MHVGSILGAGIAVLACVWGIFIVVRGLKSGSAGPYSRDSQPVNYWARIVARALFVVMCLTYFVWFVLSK